MLVFVNALAHVVLFRVEADLLGLGQVTAVRGHVSLLLVLNVLFAFFQMRSLFWREFVVLDAIRDALLLIRLAAIDLVDAGMTGIDFPRTSAGCLAVLGLSRGGANKHQTPHCHD